MADFNGYVITRPTGFGANSGWGISAGIASIQDDVDPRKTAADGGGTVDGGGVDDTSGDETLVVSFGSPSLGSDIEIPTTTSFQTVDITAGSFTVYAYTPNDNIPTIRYRWGGGSWSSPVTASGSAANSAEWDVFAIGSGTGTLDVELLGDSNGDTLVSALVLIQDYTITETDYSAILAGCFYMDPVADGETQQYGGSFQNINDEVRSNATTGFTDGSISCFVEDNVGQFRVQSLSHAYIADGIGLPLNVTSATVYFKVGDIDPKSVNVKWGRSWLTAKTSFGDPGNGWRSATFAISGDLSEPIGNVEIEFKCNDTSGDDNEIEAAYFQVCYSAWTSGVNPGIFAAGTLLNQTIRPPWL